MKNKENSYAKDVYGHYLALDIYGCEHKAVGDIRECYLYLDGLAPILGMKKASSPCLVYTDEETYPDKAGLSGWIPLIHPESRRLSGVSIHTLTPTDFISIDIYGCGSIDIEKIKEFTAQIFHPERMEEQYLLRGEFMHKKI